MKTGTVAMLDALGFKGIWNRPDVRVDPNSLMRKLQELAAESERAMDESFGDAERRQMLATDSGNLLESVRASFLSDTIVVGVSVKPRDTLPHLYTESNRRQADVLWLAARVLAVKLTCLVVSRIIALASVSEPALAYRGTLAEGQFELLDRFLLGPAVDEAASNMDRAQGAFVWMAPSAAELWSADPFLMRQEHGRSSISYDVPIKGGDRFRTYVVSPYSNVLDDTARAAIAEKILGTFGGGRAGLDVAVKRQHTEALLRACLEAARVADARRVEGQESSPSVTIPPTDSEAPR